MARSVPALLALLLGPAQILAAQELGSLAGTVRDTAGRAIAGAEVLLGNKRLLTTAQGRFLADSIPAGNHLLTIRLVGYAALRTPVAVRAGTNQYDYVLHPAVQSLPTLRVEARRTGLYGTVGDTSLAPLAGAQVHLVGRGGDVIVTDLAGRFAFPRATAGQYAVRIVLTGYAEQRLFIELKREEGVELAIRLRPSRAIASRVDEEAFHELGRRLVTNRTGDRLNAGQLERYGSLGLCDLPGFIHNLRIVPSVGLTIILNGNTIMRNMPARALCAWGAADVELIEFGYSVCRDGTNTIAQMLNMWCTRSLVERNFSSNPRGTGARDVPPPRGGGARVQPQPGPFVVIWERR